MGHIQSTYHRDGTSENRCGGFIPNHGAACANKGQEHGLNCSADFHGGGDVPQDNAGNQRSKQRPLIYGRETVDNAEFRYPVI